ncbi:hypothetical protein ACTXT7_015553 [Hymenolepis weldensis]
MNCYEYRHRATAQWFLSSISLDGSSCDFSKTNKYNRGLAGQGFVAVAEDDDDDDDKIGFKFTDGLKISASSSKLDLSRSQKLSDLPARKNVCFGEVFGEGAINENEPHISIHQIPGRSISTTSRHELLTHSSSESFSVWGNSWPDDCAGSLEFRDSTVEGRSSLVPFSTRKIPLRTENGVICDSASKFE